MPRSNIGGWHSHDEIYNIKKFKPLGIHFLLSSPPITNICNYGVDFSDIEELVAVKYNSCELYEKLIL